MTTIIYHSADFDGVFCREIAKKFVPNAELIGWNFGDALVEIKEGSLVYILDLSPDCLTHLPPPGDLVWIDHHKTSIEKWPSSIIGCRIDGVAACRLAWQWFKFEGLAKSIPTLQDYKDRKVIEPYSVRLAGEYDIWDRRDPNAETFQYALRSCDPEPVWKEILNETTEASRIVENMIIGGRLVQTYQKNNDKNLVTKKSYFVQWEGLRFLVLNTGSFNSLTFAALDKPETGHDALLGYMYNGRTWTVSLYHAKHRTDLDLSSIAVKYGGGGHRGACGFTCKKLPF